jgi:hypothetical protein
VTGEHRLPKAEHLAQTNDSRWGGGKLEGEAIPHLTIESDVESVPDIVTLRPDTVLLMYTLPVTLQVAALPYLGFPIGGYRIEGDMLTLRGLRLIGLN